MNLSATGIAVLILILHLILGPGNDPAPSKKRLRHIGAARFVPESSCSDCTLLHHK